MDLVDVWNQGSGMRKSSWSTELTRIKSDVACTPFCVLFGTSQGLQTTALRLDTSFAFIPTEFLDSTSKDLNGSYGSRQVHLNATGVDHRDLWYTFKIKHVSMTGGNKPVSYIWHQVMCLSLQLAQRKSNIVICLDFPKKLRHFLESKLASTDVFCFWVWHGLMLEGVRDMYDLSVWSLRNFIRSAERTRTLELSTRNFQPDFVYLHEIARHVLHSNETLDVAVIIAKHMHDACNSHEADCETCGKQQLIPKDRLITLQVDLQAIRRRSESLKERLQNEISLAFNLVAQRDSRLMVDIGKTARQDNNNMRSIAVVGLVYLPATFVSGIFGMNFFQFECDAGTGRQGWQVSENFWLYWAITIPLTLTTVVVWVLAFHGQKLGPCVRGIIKSSAPDAKVNEA